MPDTPAPASPAPAGPAPATYVLVPGAWLGGWAWDDVAERLRAAGHRVHAVSLSGMAEHADLATPETDLDAHVDDVVALLESHDLRDVVLVGHSYAALVVTGAVDRAPERVAAVVYVDSAPLEDGQAMLDLFGPDGAAEVEATVAAGDGWRLPFPGWDGFDAEGSTRGLGAAARERVERLASPQPFGTYRQPLRLTGAGADVARVAIACDEIQALVAAGPLAFLAAPPWTYRELDTGHWPMLSEPEALADLLVAVAAPGEPGAEAPSSAVGARSENRPTSGG